jgi:hypothetical protein
MMPTVLAVHLVFLNTNSLPAEKQFRDFWMPRGSCEYFGTAKGSR